MVAIGTTEPRVVFFGMFGPLSRAPLAALLAAGVDVRAVVVPGQGGNVGARPLPPADRPGHPTLPLSLLNRTIVDLARERGVPVLEVAQLDGVAVAAVAAYAPDLIAVSCFPHKFPPALLALPRLGCLNLHPALLPRNRGPAPLFWIFREGLGHGGATVHLMDRGLDSGPIVAQESFALADGMTGSELELRAAALGADLMVGAVGDLAAGRARPVRQDEATSTTDRWPDAPDFVIGPDRPARWAFNFIRGTAGWGHPHLLALDGVHFAIQAARAYDPEARLTVPFVSAGDELRVQCSPGVLTATATPIR